MNVTFFVFELFNFLIHECVNNAVNYLVIALSPKSLIKTELEPFKIFTVFF